MARIDSHDPSSCRPVQRWHRLAAAALCLACAAAAYAHEPVQTEIVKPSGEVVLVVSDDQGNVFVIEPDGTSTAHRDRLHTEVDVLTEPGDVVRHTFRDEEEEQ